MRAEGARNFWAFNYILVYKFSLNNLGFCKKKWKFSQKNVFGTSTYSGPPVAGRLSS